MKVTAIAAAHERAIAAVLAWIEDDVAVIWYGAGGVYCTRPAHGLVAAHCRPLRADHDGCDTREEVLISEAVVKPRQGQNCRLTGGKWRSAYDGKTLTNARQLDIDHVAPLRKPGTPAPRSGPSSVVSTTPTTWTRFVASSPSAWAPTVPKVTRIPRSGCRQ
ncbi:hypothetical protein T261_8579 [Streptomyces lydicus]|nr:hypothetical protein T261_8579 [Streptomyces lydicus]